MLIIRPVQLDDLDQLLALAQQATYGLTWIETIETSTNRCAMGLNFREITQQDKDRIFRFVIKSQMPS